MRYITSQKCTGVNWFCSIRSKILKKIIEKNRAKPKLLNNPLDIFIIKQKDPTRHCVWQNKHNNNQI